MQIKIGTRGSKLALWQAYYIEDLLKQGGIVIFDDLLWAGYPRARANPAWAINLFLKYYKDEYTILNAYSQIILQKTAAFTDHVTTDVADLQYSDAAAKAG